MAADEILLVRSVAAFPLLRHYRWLGSPASFGYAGSLAAARREAPGRDLIRRWTGGGVVLHGADWTFSLIVPAAEVHSLSPARRSYARLHQAVIEALAACGLKARLANEAEQRRTESCFRGLSCFDVINERGEKICGGAQRRCREGLLHQGSMQTEFLPDDFLICLADCLAARRESFEAEEGFWEQAAALAAGRYATPGWLERVG